jgi:2-hydroxychromene-2-carboxylate isomerase
MIPVAHLYGDYACPHTYLVDARLDVLAAEGVVSVAWRPVLTYGVESAADWRALGDGAEPPDVAAESLGRAAAQLGLTLLLPKVPPATALALQASEFARDCGAADWIRLHSALFRAVFVDGVDIGVPGDLLAVADSAGIDAVGLQAALDDSRYLSALDEVEEEASRYAIDATPTVLIGRFKLVGSAPMDVLRSTAERAAASV